MADILELFSFCYCDCKEEVTEVNVYTPPPKKSEFYHVFLVRLVLCRDISYGHERSTGLGSFLQLSWLWDSP